MMDIFEHCVCPRDRWEPILSQGDEVLGQRCRDCGNVVRWSGTCCFCEAKTDHVIVNARRHYCSNACLREEREARQAKNLEAARAAKKAKREQLLPTALFKSEVR